MTSAPAISVRDLTLELPVLGRAPSKATGSLGPSGVGGRIKILGNTRRSVVALNGISFEAARGERLGLIGTNGAGKSTLLRILAGIYPPTGGSCTVNGRTSVLFSSAVGLYPEATGYENILLMGRLLGLSRAEAEALIPEVDAFAELGDYLKMPLRAYSAGMRTRLGFAISTAMEPDVLLIDEVIGVGDARFKKKAQSRIEALIARSGTLVLATHSNGMLRQLCDRVLWLEKGDLKMIGPTEDVLKIYRRHRRLAAE